MTELAHPADLYWTGRLTLLSHQSHLAVYDDLFYQFWLALDHAALDPLGGVEVAPTSRANPRRAALRPIDEERDPTGRQEGLAGTGPASSAVSGRWQIGAPYVPPGAAPERTDESPDPDVPPGIGWYSDLELLRDKDFAAYTEVDRGILERIMAQSRVWLEPRLRSRRSRPASGGRRIDLRRTVSTAIRRAGEPLEIRWRERRRRWRKWVFLCDISASMAPYVGALLRFLQVVAARRQATEVFVFGTRLTRVTPQLRRNRPLRAVRDWQGGTRLGESLAQFYRLYGRRGMAHGAVLFILSDGLDLGRIGLTGQVMAQLDRTVNRIVWINPLAQSANYSPTAQAMAEALPFIDEFSSGHTLQSLIDLIKRQAEADR